MAQQAPSDNPAERCSSGQSSQMDRSDVKELNREEPGGREQTARQPADEQKTHTCKGVLFFSQAMLDRGKMPACVGVRSTPSQPPSWAAGPPDTLPSGDFKFICAGYSLYDEAQLRSAWKDAQKDPTAPVAVPFCEGLEIVSAADMAPVAPILAREGALDAAGKEGEQPAGPQDRQRQPPRPGFSPGQPPEARPPMDWSAFPERFSKTSHKILERMGSNLGFMAASFKRGLQHLSDEITGRKDR